MKQFKIKTKEILKKVVNNSIDKEMVDWPPTCSLIYGQPKRPYSKIEQKTDKENYVNE